MRLLSKCVLFVLFSISVLYSNAKGNSVIHPFYVSVTEINYSAKNKSIEVSCKMFAEDIENILKQKSKLPISLTNDKQLQQNNLLMKDYILKHLAVNIDSKIADLKFVGFEKESESIYCYFEVPNVTGLKKVDVANTILQDYKQEQINIVHVVVNGNRKSTKLDQGNKQASFNF